MSFGRSFNNLGALSPLVISLDLGTTNKVMFEDLKLPADLYGQKLRDVARSKTMKNFNS